MLRRPRTCAAPHGIPRTGRPAAVTGETAPIGRSAWITVVAVWAASRAFFFAVGAIGHAVVPQADVVGAYPEPIGALGYWAHWDGRWFAHIAVNGYDTVPSTAFFPAYPLLVRGGMELGLGIAVAGVVISTL